MSFNAETGEWVTMVSLEYIEVGGKWQNHTKNEIAGADE